MFAWSVPFLPSPIVPGMSSLVMARKVSLHSMHVMTVNRVLPWCLLLSAVKAGSIFDTAELQASLL